MSKKEGEHVHRTANKIRDASAHAGIETPVTVLIGVRSAMEDIVRLAKETGEQNNRRHEQLCTLLISVNKNMSAEPRSRESSYLSGFQQNGAEKGAYCHANVRISSGAHLVGACMLQLCSVSTATTTCHMSGR